MKYLNKTFSTPANSQAFRDGWDAVFGEDYYPDYCSPQACARCEDEGIVAWHELHDCTLPRPWTCFCHARMAGECMCGAWDDCR